MGNSKFAAILAAIKLVADAAKDTIAALKPGQSLLSQLASYQNLIGDVEALIPQIGDLSAEVKLLQPEDYVALAGALVTDLAISDAKAQAIVTASLDLLTEIAGPVLTKAEALAAAIKAA